MIIAVMFGETKHGQMIETVNIFIKVQSIFMKYILEAG